LNIQLITFDLDDTLWDVTPLMHSAEATLRAWLGEHAPTLGAVPIEHLWAIRARLLSVEPALKHRLSELRKKILLLALQEAGYPASQAEQLAEAGFQVFLSARHQVSLFPDVHATLEQLANQYQLGVITNGNADVRRLGLAEYFKFALCAEELGIGKPDPLPFQRALQHAGVQAEQAVHIGDHPEDDIAGARAAGLRSIWFNPLAKEWRGGERAHGEIRRLSELPALLASWD
jgi:FMN hydrolase / 5-amino-6-(5-phospho-D-ribitylamino)uracil phosphatase